MKLGAQIDDTLNLLKGFHEHMGRNRVFVAAYTLAMQANSLGVVVRTGHRLAYP